MSPLPTNIRAAIKAAIAADTGAGGVVPMLGTKSADSIFPNPGTQPPGDPRPWVLIQMMSNTVLDEVISASGFRVRVYDDKGQGYTRIDRIVSRLKALFPPRNIALADPGGNAIRQQLAFESEDGWDDGYQQNVRFAEWQLWRVVP